MKKSIFFLLAFYPAILVGQANSNFQIKNGLAYYSKVFEFPGQSQDSIRRYLQASLPLVPYVSNVRIDAAGLTASIAQMKINYSGLGSLLVNSMFANLIVQVKDERYRIIIKDIYFVDDSEHNDIVTDFTEYAGKSGGLLTRRTIEEFSNGLSVDQMLLRMDQYFSALFSASNLALQDDW